MAQEGIVKRGLYTFNVDYVPVDYLDELVYVECMDCQQRERFALPDGDDAADDWMYAHIKTPCVHCGYCAAEGKHEDCEADAVDVFARFYPVEAK